MKNLSPTHSAWETFQAMNDYFGTTRVRDELYSWFAEEYSTFSYEYAGILKLLTKPEKDALRIMGNATRRLAGKSSIAWKDFVEIKNRELECTNSNEPGQKGSIYE
jgi:hypothetical protein